MTRKSKKKSRIRARMAKQGVPYSVARRSADTKKPTPATPSQKPCTTVIVVPGRQLGLDGELYNLQCVAATKRGSRCRNLVEAHGQVAKWDAHGRYRVDWEATDSFWLERYGSAEQLFNSYTRQRCKLHLNSNAADAIAPETYDIGPLVPLQADVVDVIQRRASPGIMNMLRRDMDVNPDSSVDISSEAEAAAGGDVQPLLTLVAQHPLPTDLTTVYPMDPDPNFVNAPIWFELLTLHHDDKLTVDQLRQCVAVGAPTLIGELF